jgi:hypothetical protein
MFHLHIVHTGSGAHPAYPIGTGHSTPRDSVLGVKTATHVDPVPRPKIREATSKSTKRPHGFELN